MPCERKCGLKQKANDNALTVRKVMEKGRHLRFKNAVAFPVRRWLKSNTEFTFDGQLPNKDLEPAIIATNHASVYDFLFVSEPLWYRTLSYVTSEHILRVRPWGSLLNRYVSIIPHKKGGKASRTAIRILEKLAIREDVYIAVEGEQTWNGITMDIKPGNGKLVKKSGAALITFRIEGSYLLRPRWAKNLRRGKVNGKVVNIYTPEMLANMTSEAIEEAIARDLYFDIWKWQKEQQEPNRYVCKKGGLAEGLERAVCSCPSCGNIGSLSTEGDEIKCSCGFRTRFSESGFFEPAEPVETIVEWEKLDEETIAKAIKEAKDGDEIFADEDTHLYVIDKYHNENETAKGRLSLECREGSIVLAVDIESTTLDKVDSMTMVQANRLLFSIDRDYFEIRSDAANLRKYMQAFNLNKRDSRPDTSDGSE